MQNSNLQSNGYEPRVLTITPWGQMDLAAKLNRSILTLKLWIFSETSLRA